MTVLRAGGEVLEADVTYHYVITAKLKDGSFRRYANKFNTGEHTVKVFWEKVKIISDGDPDVFPVTDCGEIALWFWANFGQPGAKFFIINKLGAPGAPAKACSDHVYEINQRSDIYNAPNTLSLSVSGRDLDRDDYAGSDLFGSSMPAPLSGPRDTGDEEQNVAVGEFDLTQFEPGATVPFRLVSMPANGGSQGDLMFEIYGHIEISYPKEP